MFCRTIRPSSWLMSNAVDRPGQRPWFYLRGSSRAPISSEQDRSCSSPRRFLRQRFVAGPVRRGSACRDRFAGDARRRLERVAHRDAHRHAGADRVHHAADAPRRIQHGMEANARRSCSTTMCVHRFTAGSAGLRSASCSASWSRRRSPDPVEKNLPSGSAQGVKPRSRRESSVSRKRMCPQFPTHTAVFPLPRSRRRNQRVERRIPAARHWPAHPAPIRANTSATC